MKLVGKVILVLITVAMAATMSFVLVTPDGTVQAEGSTFTVTNTNDSGAGSLRQAILDANASPGTDTIEFNIPDDGPHTIQPASALPTITDPVIIDGYTQPGASPNTNPPGLGSNAVLMIELDGSNAGFGANGLRITAGSSTVRGLVINRFDWYGIMLETNGGNVIEGNFIGTDVTGTVALGNGRYGVVIKGAPSNTIGGTTPEARNLISANGGFGGVFIDRSGATQNQVLGNFIGTDVTGTAELGNDGFGMVIRGGASNNTVGGTMAGAGNVISGNDSSGVAIIDVDTTGNQVLGNFIGTDVTGAANLGNGQYGVLIQHASGNTIGGTAAGARNVISGNNWDGVFIFVSYPFGNRVQGNFIGTDVTGTADLGNTRNGVYLWADAPNNTIGGTTAGAGNTIAFNGGDGVYVYESGGNGILSNSIFSNTGLGIDLGADGVTPNDAGDGDTGANNLQNFPVLISASIGGSTTIEGMFNSTPDTEFRVEFFSNTTCDPSGHGEGETFLGSANVTTNGSGDASFSVTFPVTVPEGYYITATATDPNNNTSEFSQCLIVDTTPPTMEIIAEAQAQYYNGAPSFSNFGFDDHISLDDGWYQMDSYSGNWTALFTDAPGTSWDSDNWTVPGFDALTEGSHTIYFKASDDAGNVEGESGEWGWQFFKDTTSPTVVSTSPVDGATSVSVDTVVTATFSEPIDEATIVFTLDTVNGSVSYSGTTATFIPDANLDYSTTYAASIQASDLAGNPMAQAYTWSFTTGEEGVDILAYYRGLDGDLSDVSDEDLLQAAYDWAHHVIPNGFDTWLSDTELLQLAHEWAS